MKLALNWINHLQNATVGVVNDYIKLPIYTRRLIMLKHCLTLVCEIISKRVTIVPLVIILT